MPGPCWQSRRRSLLNASRRARCCGDPLPIDPEQRSISPERFRNASRSRGALEESVQPDASCRPGYRARPLGRRYLPYSAQFPCPARKTHRFPESGSLRSWREPQARAHPAACGAVVRPSRRRVLETLALLGALPSRFGDGYLLVGSGAKSELLQRLANVVPIRAGSSAGFVPPSLPRAARRALLPSHSRPVRIRSPGFRVVSVVAFITTCLVVRRRCRGWCYSAPAGKPAPPTISQSISRTAVAGQAIHV
jgi:hypothetical protein